MTDYRAELRLLVEAAESFTEPALGHHRPWAKAMDRARATLAEGDGVGASDGDAHELWALAQLAPGEGITDGVDRITQFLARYATHPRPIPVAELQALLSPGYELGDGSMDGAQIVDCEWWHPEMGCDSLQFAVDNCRAIAHPRPIPVAERPWERPGFCDAEGKCWWGRPSEELCNSDWFLATRAEVEEFCSDCLPIVCLPAADIPLPEGLTNG